MNGQVGLAAAFVAGLASFLSPCVLPMVPAYASFLARLAGAAGEGASRSRSLLVPSLLFVAGFSVVFVTLGSTASVAGMALVPYKAVLARVAGLVVVCFGVLTLGIIRVPWLYREFRIDPAASKRLGRWAAPVMGAAFGFGWTPCVGPILGTILLVAGSGTSVATGAGLLVAYSVGLGVPFVLFAVFLERLRPLLRWLERHSTGVSRISGSVLIVFGLLLATGTLQQVTGFFTRVIPFSGG
jgi:cytochrome c-type biogenesis protein